MAFSQHWTRAISSSNYHLSGKARHTACERKTLNSLLGSFISFLSFLYYFFLRFHFDSFFVSCLKFILFPSLLMYAMNTVVDLSVYCYCRRLCRLRHRTTCILSCSKERIEDKEKIADRCSIWPNALL